MSNTYRDLEGLAEVNRSRGKNLSAYGDFSCVRDVWPKLADAEGGCFHREQYR
jgi:hypothetical protein